MPSGATEEPVQVFPVILKGVPGADTEPTLRFALPAFVTVKFRLVWEFMS